MVFTMALLFLQYVQTAASLRRTKQSPKPHPKSLSGREGLKNKVSSFGEDLEGLYCHVASHYDILPNLFRHPILQSTLQLACPVGS